MKDPRFSELLAQATEVVEGQCFNQRAWELREATKNALSYEISEPGDEAFEAFVQRTRVRLQIHLQAKSRPTQGDAGLLLWIWYQEKAYLYSGSLLLDYLLAVHPKPGLVLAPGPKK